MATYTYCPVLPLELDENSNFISIEEQIGNVKQKLRMILLTNPGEKIMDPEFGLGIKKYLFEPVNGALSIYYNAVEESKNFIIEDFRATIIDNLIKQTKKYSPDITINDINIKIDEFVMFLTVNYSYKGLYANETTFTISAWDK